MLQRFRSALNLNLHFHILVLDGQYVRDPQTGRLVWTRARTPTTEQIERLVERLAERSETWLVRGSCWSAPGRMAASPSP